MLASLLPGLRDVRTPLTVGYLWLVLAWFWWSEGLASALNESEVGDRVRELAEAFGTASVVAALSFVAYLLGAVLTLSTDRGLLRTILGRVRPMVLNVDAMSVHQAYGQALDSHRAGLLERAKDGGASDDEVAPYAEYLEHAATRTLPVDLRPHLLVANQEMFGEYDRLDAESTFRLNLCLPLLALAVTLGIELSGWFFLVGPLVAMVFFFQGLSRQYAAEAVILQAVLAGVIEHPFLALQSAAEPAS